MGNKGSFNPLPKYEQAYQQLTLSDAADLKSKFRDLSENSETISLDAFCRVMPATTCLFFNSPLDFKKDSVLDQEEFMCAVAFFRSSSLDDHIRFLFLMYDTGKVSGSGYLPKENLRQLIIDSMIAAQREEVPLQNMEFWMQNMGQLSEAMVETALVQFGGQSGKMDSNEFINFVKVEGTIQAYLTSLPTFLGEPPLSYK